MKFNINNKEYDSEIIKHSGETLVMKINGKKHSFTIKQLTRNSFLLQSGTKQSHMMITDDKNGGIITYCCGEAINVEHLEAGGLKPSKTKGSGIIEIKAPIPGLINEIACKPGDRLKAGDVVCVLDAMKMHNEINSPEEGTIEKIFAKAGQQVEKNALLATLKCRK